MNRRPRILVLAADRGLAEGLVRGLDDLHGRPPEIDVVLSPEFARERLTYDDYDVLVVELATLSLSGVDSAETGCAAPPLVIAVGGAPGSNGLFPGIYRRVPLPLSFRLLRHAVADALAGRPPDVGEEPRRRHGTIG